MKPDRLRLAAYVLLLFASTARAGTAFAPRQAEAAAAELNGALSRASLLLNELDASSKAYTALGPAGVSGYVEPSAGLNYCVSSPLALEDKDTGELTFYGGCQALASKKPGDCRGMDLIARTSLDDVTDCTGIYWDMGLTRSLIAGRSEFMEMCAGNIRFRKPEMPQAEVAAVCAALRKGPDVESSCRALGRQFPTQQDCLHAFGIYRGEDCASHNGAFDYQRRFCESAGDYARAYKAKSPALCRDYLCRFLMGDGEACENFLRALKSERCKAQIGSPSRSPAPKTIEPLLALARRALLATSGRPISDAEREAARRLHLMLISARPFEPAQSYADLLLLEKSRVEVLLFRAGALREALGPDLTNQPQIERTLVVLRRRLAAF